MTASRIHDLRYARLLLPRRGVRSRRFCQRFERTETAAFGGEPCQQRRWYEAFVARARRIGRQPVADVGKPNVIGVVHGPAAPDRPTVSVDPDHVDIAGSCRDSFVENTGS